VVFFGGILTCATDNVKEFILIVDTVHMTEKGKQQNNPAIEPSEEVLESHVQAEDGALEETSVTSENTSIPDQVEEESVLLDDPFEQPVYLTDDIFSSEQTRRSIHWSVAWSDLMMTMFIFFVVLYAYSVAHREFLTGEGLGSDIGSSVGTGAIGAGGGGGIGEATIPALEIGPQVFDLSVLAETEEADIIREFASVELAPDQTVRIILTADLLFDLGKAQIKPRAKKKLTKIAELIRRSPNKVNVIGHTDNIPMRSARFPSNWELSVTRATSVTRFLIDEMKVPGSRFYVSGHSYYQPIEPNTTAKNRATNRRVEIVITRDVPHVTSGAVEDIL